MAPERPGRRRLKGKLYAKRKADPRKLANPERDPTVNESGKSLGEAMRALFRSKVKRDGNNN